MEWKVGDACMVEGQVFRIDAFDELVLDGKVLAMVKAYAFDSDSPMQLPVAVLTPLPPHEVLEARRARLVAPIEGRVERRTDDREAELAAAVRHADRAIDALRRLVASGASVDNRVEQVYFRKLLPWAVTPVAVGLGEDIAALAVEAGIGVPSRAHWMVAWWK